MSRQNIKGQMSRLRQNICYASLLACGERSARALRADDCHFWIRIVKFGGEVHNFASFGVEVYKNHHFGGEVWPPPTQHNASISRSRALPTATAPIKFFSLQIFSCIWVPKFGIYSPTFGPFMRLSQPKAQLFKKSATRISFEGAYLINDPGRRLLARKIFRVSILL